MTDKNNQSDVNKVDEEDDLGHIQTDLHEGAEAIFEMGDYALSEAQKVALGIHSLAEAEGVLRGEATEASRASEDAGYDEEVNTEAEEELP